METQQRADEGKHANWTFILIGVPSTEMAEAQPPRCFGISEKTAFPYQQLWMWTHYESKEEKRRLRPKTKQKKKKRRKRGSRFYFLVHCWETVVKFTHASKLIIVKTQLACIMVTVYFLTLRSFLLVLCGQLFATVTVGQPSKTKWANIIIDKLSKSKWN